MRRVIQRLFAPLGMLWATAHIAARRLIANRRLVAGLLLGFIVAVAGASSVPVYTTGAFQRMLGLQLMAQPGEKQPAALEVAYFEDPTHFVRAAQFEQADEIAHTQGPALIGLPIDPMVTYGSLALTRATPVDETKMNPNVQRNTTLAFLSDLEQHTTVVDGRWPRPGQQADGVYEVAVEQPALTRLDLVLGNELSVPLSRSAAAPTVNVRVVGVFQRTDPTEPYWYSNTPYDRALFVDRVTFVSDLLSNQSAEPGQYTWYYGIKSADVKMTDLTRLLTGFYDLEARMGQALPGARLFKGPYDLMTNFLLQANRLELLFLLITVLPLMVVAYFLAVTSARMVDGQRQEIAVLRSRGASLWQVLQVYLMESVLLGLLALVGGYPLGILLARVMGAANGFLSFVNRVQPPVLLPPDFWLAGLGAVLVAMVAYVLPAVGAARESILSYKQESARHLRQPAWARFGLDLLCLAVAAYGYYLLLQRQTLLAGGTAAGAALMQPLDIVTPGLFVLGSGLLALRLIPPVARLVSRLFQRRAGAPLYLTLTQWSRAPGGYTAVVLLLTMTVGVGLYSAAAARTLQQDLADRIHYQAGAQVTVSETFNYVRTTGADGTTRSTVIEPPPWDLQHNLPGVLGAARVATLTVTPSAGGRIQPSGTLMAIDPVDFSHVAWFRNDLAPAQLNAYLNLLGQNQAAVLVSPAFAEAAHIRPGDWITLRNGNGADLSLVVYATVPYWPSLYPAESDFFIANLDYVELNLGLTPYQVWFKLRDDTSLADLVDSLRANGIAVDQATDTRQELVVAQRDPKLGGLLGGLTSGFLLSALIALLGFWLYSAFSLRARVLQFGVLQAMGLSLGQLVSALALEQVITVGLGIALGTGIGMGVTTLFVPFLQQGTGRDQVPPFRVIMDPGDRLHLYLVMGFMLLVGLAGLMLTLRRLKVHEALKLGEDQ